MALDRDAPIVRAVQPASRGKVVSLPRVGGLHHDTRGRRDSPDQFSATTTVAETYSRRDGPQQALTVIGDESAIGEGAYDELHARLLHRVGPVRQRRQRDDWRAAGLGPSARSLLARRQLMPAPQRAVRFPPVAQRGLARRCFASYPVGDRVHETSRISRIARERPPSVVAGFGTLLPLEEKLRNAAD
jgi:hypothetical protein